MRKDYVRLELGLSASDNDDTDRLKALLKMLLTDSVLIIICIHKSVISSENSKMHVKCVAPMAKWCHTR